MGTQRSKRKDKQLLRFSDQGGGGGVALGVAIEEWLPWHPEEQRAQIICQL